MPRTAIRGIAAALAGTAALAAALAPPAAAWRAPSAEELAAMAGATGPPTEPVCVRGRISERDDRWGALFAIRGGAGCSTSERVFVLRRARPGTPGSRWAELRQGVRFGLCSTDLPGIPDAVGVELGVCAPPSRHVAVPVGARFAVRPARLPHSRNVMLTGLRWSAWGGRTATGRGTFAYRDASGGHRVPVRVVLSDVGLCGSTRTYLGRRLVATRAQDRDEIAPYAGTWSVHCPGVTGRPARSKP